jgi:hypothetical protein
MMVKIPADVRSFNDGIPMRIHKIFDRHMRALLINGSRHKDSATCCRATFDPAAYLVRQQLCEGLGYRSGQQLLLCRSKTRG